MGSRHERRYRPGVEGLDGRALMAGGVTASLAGGVLAVAGTEAADRIAIDVRGFATPKGERGLVVVEGVGRFRMSGIAAIVVAGGAGDDVIAIEDGGGPSRPAILAGGLGNDVILGGSGPNVIDGGPGDDVIATGPGDDVIAGGGGLDRIDPGLGHDLVEGVLHIDGVPILPPVPAPPLPAPQPASALLAAPAPDPLEAMAAQIVSLSNARRLEAGLAALTVSPSLSAAARLQAEQMARLGRMEHTLPGAAYPGLADRIKHVGYVFSRVAENVATAYDDGPAAVSAWMASAPHRANLLDAQVTEIGAGVARDPLGNLYFCQVFGKPQAPPTG